MIVVVPTPIGVTRAPEIVATLGLEDENCQGPGEVEEGTFKLNDPMLSRETVRSGKGPIRGLMAVICKVLLVEAERKVLVLCCMAFMVMVPASTKLTIFPESEAIVYPLTTLLERL